MAKKLVDFKQDGLHVTLDNTEELEKAINLLLMSEVLVGFPEETTDRPDDPVSNPMKITNASLGYIHDNGAPEAHIPARPFMEPGMKSVEGQVTDTLAKAAQYALAGRSEAVGRGFERVGLIAVKGIQTTIRQGIPPPLADSTLRARAKKGRAGANKELERRAKGLAPGMHNAVPLMDTNEMLKSVSYVVRKARNVRRTNFSSKYGS